MWLVSYAYSTTGHSDSELILRFGVLGASPKRLCIINWPSVIQRPSDKAHELEPSVAGLLWKYRAHPQFHTVL